MEEATEKSLEVTIIAYLRARGFWCQKVPSGAMFTKRGPKTYKVKLADEGTPDILACIHTKFVGIEVKKNPEEYAEWVRQWEKHLETKQEKESWKRSLAQHREHNKIRAGNAAGVVIVCSSVDELHADIEELLQEWGVGKSSLNRPQKLD
jgi:hypothetical protein